MKHSTDTTGRFLVPEDHYTAMIAAITRKEVKEFIIYDWAFEALVNDKPFYFKIGLFQSQMGELLRALGATETTPGKFDWQDEDYVGITLEFNITHVTDKKGVIREQLSDITKPAVLDPSQIEWKDAPG